MLSEIVLYNGLQDAYLQIIFNNVSAIIGMLHGHNISSEVWCVELGPVLPPALHQCVDPMAGVASSSTLSSTWAEPSWTVQCWARGRESAGDGLGVCMFSWADMRAVVPCARVSVEGGNGYSWFQPW